MGDTTDDVPTDDLLAESVSENGDGENETEGQVDDTVATDDLGEDSLANEGSLLDETNEDADLEAIKARMKEMEEEAQKLREYTSEAEDSLNMSGSTTAASPGFLSPEEKKEADNRSIYVGNVDYGATAEELASHFHGCGSINRVTINCDKYTGHPKGFAYIEFADADSIEAAQALDESLFRGRQIKVTPKRTNIPGHSTTNRPMRGGRGRYMRGSRGFRGGYRGRAPSFRGAYRGRGRFTMHYSPY